MFSCRQVTQTSIAMGLRFGIMLTLLISASLFSSQSIGQPFASPVDCEISAITHQFEPGHHLYAISGECYSADEGKWGITIDVKWFGKDKRVHERILIGKYGGELWATCPADPVIDDSECFDVSYSGIYDLLLDDYTTVEPILQSRAHVSDLQKSQIRVALAAEFPAPSIEHPLNSYLYSDPFEEAPGEYEIPVLVTMPYSAGVVVTVHKQVNGFTIPEQVQRHHENANDLSSDAYGDGRIYAYRDAYRLPAGKYRLYAWGQEGTHWQSDSSYIEFAVVEKKAIEQVTKDSGFAVANRSDVTTFSDIKKRPSKQAVEKDSIGKSKLRQPTLAGKPTKVKRDPHSVVDFSLLSPKEGVRYRLKPRFIVTAPNRSDIVYRINECEFAGSSSCNQHESTISGSRMSCDEDDRNCRYDALLEWDFSADKAYMLIVNLTPYQGTESILVNFEVGRFGEEMEKQPVTSASGIAVDNKPIEAAMPVAERQPMLAKPEVISPKADERFKAPARFRIRARIADNQPVMYGVRKAGEVKNIKTTGMPMIRDLDVGEYCVYVMYTPNGPESECVPFSVELSRGLFRKRQPATVD